MPGLARYTGPARLHRRWKLIRTSEACDPRDPHRYVYLVGVEPEHQGRGLGSALIRAGLEACDRDGLPADLESSKAATSRSTSARASASCGAST